jgi:peptidoglycan/LPS O-acetylase OafA/YrhL
MAAIQTWSLAIEEQFYLFWPLIIGSASRLRIVLTALWLIGTCVATRLWGLYPTVALGRADGLAFGAILAVIFRDKAWIRRKSKSLSWMLISLGLATFAFIAGPASSLESPIRGISGYGPFSLLAINALYFSIVGVVLLHAKHPVLVLLRSRFLIYLGRISYGIFLYHLLVIELVERCISPGSVAAHATSLLLSVFVAATSWEFFERRIGRLKDRFPYKKPLHNVAAVAAIGKRV